MELDIVDLTRSPEPTEDEQYAALMALQRRCYRIAEEHGFHDGRSPDRVLMLLVSELAECFEHLRDGHDLSEWWWVCKGCGDRLSAAAYADGAYCCGNLKPDGPAVEWADLWIRMLDTAEEFGLPTADVLHAKLAYNESRPYKHGRLF